MPRLSGRNRLTRNRVEKIDRQEGQDNRSHHNNKRGGFRRLDDEERQNHMFQTTGKPEKKYSSVFIPISA